MTPSTFRLATVPATLLVLLSPWTGPCLAASPPESSRTASLTRVRVFPESLAPVGGEPNALENAALETALRSLTQGGSRAALDGFIEQHPRSPWLPSLLLNRGLLRFDEGYFSSALADWTQAWSIGRAASQTSPEGAAIVARALAEAVKMHCRVGRVAEAKALLAEFGDRPVFGLNASMLDQSRKAIGQMETMPADCFKCGPFALSSILHHQRTHTRETLACITTYPTTAQGTSLAEVARLAQGPLGMKMQAARRLSAQAPLLLPAVVHWKLNHYGALLEYKDGRYLFADPTFGTSQWIGPEAIAQESDGYFLVPAGPLPAGWVAVSEAEAGSIWGRGDCAVGDGNGTGPNAPRTPKCGKGRGMAIWSIHTSLASLNVEDIPLAYAPPVGPAFVFRVNYSQLEQNQPTTLNYSNVGPLWNLSLVSSLTFDSNNARARMGDGGTELYTRFNSGTNTYDPDQASGCRLVRVAANHYERRSPDDSKLVFATPDGSGRLFLTQAVDPQGNAITFQYDGNFRLVSVTDAIGQVSLIEHGSNAPGHARFYRVTKVTDPFGRFTTLAYDAQDRLTSVTDPVGIASIFGYNANGQVTTLTTPYGTTSFAFGTTNAAPQGVVSFVEVTEPNGARQRVESLQYSTTPATETRVPVGMPTHNDYMQYRNSYYWDRKAMADAPGDYTKAQLSHFLHLNIASIKANVVESTKSPLENRVWYAYQGQGDPIYTTEGMSAGPSHIGRVLDDGSSQVYRYTYNPQGNVTQATDPLGRITKFGYAANGIDLLTVKQVNAQGGDDLLATYTWNAQHRPLTFTDAGGQTTTCTYNARGQLTTLTNPRGEVVNVTYTAQGFLDYIDGPLPGPQDRTTYGYDAAGRISVITNGEGYRTELRYDDLDRPTRTIYHDGTYEEVGYATLDASTFRDRRGRLTTTLYDAVRQPTSMTDPLGRVTRFEWCVCGSLRQAEDALGRITRWEQDILGRPTSKIYPDGTREIYAYEQTTSRLASVTDSRGQTRIYLYCLDDAVEGVIYPPAAGVAATPLAWYSYDAAYPRLRSVIDGTGTTTYSYGPVSGGVPLNANRLEEIYTTWTNSRIRFSYDEVGALYTRSIDGVTQTFQRDALGRLGTLQNALGNFVYTYENASSRVLRVDLPNGQTAHGTYFGNANDRRLQQLRNVATGGALLSQFDYVYDVSGDIQTWEERVGNQPSLLQTMVYDAASQLRGVLATGRTYGFSYDDAGNRTSRTLNGNTVNFTYNILNELQSATPALGSDKTYTWDAENRPTRIDYAGGNANTRLVYDSGGRCVGLSEFNGNTLVSEKRFVWCGPERCEERTAAGTVTRRFFAQGEQVGASNYYYAFDHLGSVREMTDSTGALRARYEYDPFGIRTRVAGDLEASAGYTGHYFHAPSGLHFTRHRAYDAATARWLSRDPLKEEEGLNYYAYVGNTPVNATDPLGLYTFQVGWSAGGTLAAGAGGTATYGRGFIIDTQGTVGIYESYSYGLAAGAKGGVGGLSFGFTGADTIDEATAGNNFTASLGGGVAATLSGELSGGTKKNGDGYLGFGGTLGLGAGLGGSLTTGPSEVLTDFNIPDAARAAAAAAKAAAKAAFAGAYGFDPSPAAPKAKPKPKPAKPGPGGRRIPGAPAKKCP